MDTTLNIRRNPDAWILTLDRPSKRNALCTELIEALISAVEEAHARCVPLLVFRGAGRNLSAGFDFTGYEDQSEGDLLYRMVRIEHLLQLIARSPALTLSYAHGRNFGAGVDLFAACKLRHCSPDASFRMPGLKFGLVLGSRRFRDIVGTSNALSILSSTRTFSADEAVNLGFVESQIGELELDDLLANATQMATTLDPQTRASLYRVLDTSDALADADMAALVRSASRPGIKARIQAYLAGSLDASKPKL